METEKNVTAQKRGRAVLALTDDIRCPYTSEEEWDGKCYDGRVCENPYLDFVPTHLAPQNYCRKKGMPLWMLELDRKKEPLFKRSG